MPSCLNYMIEDRLEAHELAAIKNCSSLARLCKQLALASGSDDTKDSLITRSFINVHDRNTPINNHVTGAYNKSSNSELVATCNHSLGVSGNVDSYSLHPSSTVTVMQWNVLSQSKCQCFSPARPPAAGCFICLLPAAYFLATSFILSHAHCLHSSSDSCRRMLSH